MATRTTIKTNIPRPNIPRLVKINKKDNFKKKNQTLDTGSESRWRSMYLLPVGVLGLIASHMYAYKMGGAIAEKIIIEIPKSIPVEEIIKKNNSFVYPVISFGKKIIFYALAFMGGISLLSPSQPILTDTQRRTLNWQNEASIRRQHAHFLPDFYALLATEQREQREQQYQ